MPDANHVRNFARLRVKTPKGGSRDFVAIKCDDQARFTAEGFWLGNFRIRDRLKKAKKKLDTVGQTVKI